MCMIGEWIQLDLWEPLVSGDAASVSRTHQWLSPRWRRQRRFQWSVVLVNVPQLFAPLVTHDKWRLIDWLASGQQYTRRMAIAKGTCVSFCNQSKAHFGLPWVCHWDNGGKCHMDEKTIQCLSNASQHVPIYLQPFPSNSTRNFKSSPFYHILASPGYAPVTIAVNVTWMERGFKCIAA